MPDDQKKHETLAEAEWPAWLVNAEALSGPIAAWAEGAPALLACDGRALDEPSRRRLWRAIERGGATLDRFRAFLDPDSLREHVWALFSRWAEHDAAKGRGWILDGLRLIIDDELAEKVGPIVEGMIRDDEKSAAKAGLEVLLAHGTPASLRVVSGLARRLRHDGVYNLPRAMLASEAARRDLSLEELEDRLVPSSGPGALDVQRERLERALSTGRDWSVRDWNELLREHPLVRRLTRRLVWGQYGDGGALLMSFRVDEGDELTDERDEPIELDPGARIRVAHPVDLTPSARAAWGDLFSDYELIPPFAQLARPVKTGHSEDMDGHTLRRLPTRAVEPDLLREILTRLGWIEGEPDDHVRVGYFTKRFDRAGLFAILVLDPGVGVDAAPQTASEIYFLDRAPGGLSYERAERVPLAKVPATALSEVLHDAAVLAE